MKARGMGLVGGSLIALSVSIALFILTACSTSKPVNIQAQRIPPPPTSDAGAARPPADGPSLSGPVQSSSGGAVTIDARWRLVGRDSLVFEIAMDTHSVDLDGIDLKKLAVLRDDQGNQYVPSSWTAPAGGHHRSGKLVFPAPESLTEGKMKSLQLIIRDVAGVKERVLSWNPA